MTLRLRLTLLYGGVFIAAGAGLLAVTYGLFKHNQKAGSESLAFHSINFKLPAGAQVSAQSVDGAGGATVESVGGSTNVHQVAQPPKRHRVLGSGPPQALIQSIKVFGQKQVRGIARLAVVKLKEQQSSDASSLLEWSAIALGVVALLSIGLAWWLAGRALRPLRMMSSRAREISAENLHERLGVEGRGDELGELATTFDALLARLEAAFESQRRFVANASHELRTPITLERTLVEVALADPEVSVESLRHVCERVVSSTEEQERLLDALLTLARSEAGVEAGESVELAEVVAEALLAREPRLAGIVVESELASAVVAGDRALLERVAANLIDNAIIHNGGEQPWIRVTTGAVDGDARLCIANGGEVVAPDQVEQLFEPFRRGAGERVGGREGGLGLGLSIVRAVVVAHGAEMEAHTLPDGGLEFELRFSSAPATVAAAKPPVGGLETVSR